MRRCDHDNGEVRRGATKMVATQLTSHFAHFPGSSGVHKEGGYSAQRGNRKGPGGGGDRYYWEYAN